MPAGLHFSLELRVFFLNLALKLNVYFWLYWGFVGAGAFSSCQVQASHCVGFFGFRAQALAARASVVVLYIIEL